MSFDFEFDAFQTQSEDFERYFEDDTPNAELDRLAEDSIRRGREKMEGREVTPQGSRDSDRRIEASGSDDAPDRVKVSSIKDLENFVRVADNMFVYRGADKDDLVRQSEQDLWSLNEDEDGELVIERLFDEDGNPIQA